MGILMEGWSVWWSVQTLSARGLAEKSTIACLTNGPAGPMEIKIFQLKGPHVILVGLRAYPPEWLGVCGDGRQWWQRPGRSPRLSSYHAPTVWWDDRIGLTTMVIDSCTLYWTPVLQESFALHFSESINYVTIHLAEWCWVQCILNTLKVSIYTKDIFWSFP